MPPRRPADGCEAANCHSSCGPPLDEARALGCGSRAARAAADLGPTWPYSQSDGSNSQAEARSELSPCPWIPRAATATGSARGGAPGDGGWLPAPQQVERSLIGEGDPDQNDGRGAARWGEPLSFATAVRVQVRLLWLQRRPGSARFLGRALGSAASWRALIGHERQLWPCRRFTGTNGSIRSALSLQQEDGVGGLGPWRATDRFPVFTGSFWWRGCRAALRGRPSAEVLLVNAAGSLLHPFFADASGGS